MLFFEPTKEEKEKFFNVFYKYKNERPKPDRNLDQFYATEETVLKRAVLLGNLTDISQKKLLFLGDDDLASVAFALLFKAEEIMVVDIDKRILEFINMISQKENLPIKIFEYDLRNSLPKSEFKRYDIAFFDPPYTPEAVNTWLIRAIEATLTAGPDYKKKKPENLSRKKYFMCYGYTDRETERGLKIQKIITLLGLIIQEKIKDFNHYYGAESIRNKSDLYVLQPTPKVNISKIDIARSQFYTGKKITTLIENVKDPKLSQVLCGLSDIYFGLESKEAINVILEIWFKDD
jgi:predicted methyltransferase